MSKHRDSVVIFANNMERVLQTKDYKGRYGWSGWTKYKLLQMLQMEVLELTRAIERAEIEDIKKEATDVANFAMMIFDNRSVLR